MSTSRRSPWPTRRHFILQVLAAAAAGGCGTTGPSGEGDASSGGSGGGTSGGSSGDVPTGDAPTTGGTTGETTTGGPALDSDPFTLGIASGDPLPDSVILWTRLAPDPKVAGGGMPDEVVAVEWEVATDEAFADVVLAGSADADPKLGHSLHIDARGLEPDSWYFYRFRVGEWTSPVGRARTLPAAGAAPERLRFASTCCQSFTDGYYTAYPHMIAEDIDLVLFLGDYIYESGATGPVRSHENPEPTTLDEYRVRHALYKSDANLRAAHARCPWLMIWDDHEVENNYVGDVSQDALPADEFLARRAAAYQAYYEHTPLRLPPPEGPDYKIYRALQWGDLAELWLLDTRQYRADQNCGDEPGPGCDGWEAYDGTVLGAEQEKWLMDGMKASTRVWKLMAQQIVFSSVSNNGSLINFDQWDGYPLARQRLLDFFVQEQLENVVVIAGDLHVGGLGDLAADAADDSSPVVAAEIVTTSMSSDGNVPPETAEALVADLPLIKYFNAHQRGYVSHEITRDVYTVRCFMVDSATVPESGGKVDAEYFIDAGVPGFRPQP
ncbi:MAG: alkaline phosphatase D family protein [Myxococcales bacterium]|nr:alkaline phosphatase D family protein [Myxococcales bacterium]